MALERLLAKLGGQVVTAGANRPLSPAAAAASRRGGAGIRQKGKRGRPAGRGLTKREQRAFDELARGGLVGLGAVDPSPQRTTVVVAACIYLLLPDHGTTSSTAEPATEDWLTAGLGGLWR